VEEEDENAWSLSEKSFEEIFKDFYKRERGVDAEDEVVDLLMSIISEEGGQDNETN